MIAWTPERKRTLQITGVVLLLILALLGWFAWYKFFREVPQPQFDSEDERFMYGSIGAEATAGIPYWILYVLPRIFPDKLPGPAGYASFGAAVGAGKRAAGRFHQEDHRLRSRGQQLRGVPRGDRSPLADGESALLPHRPRSHLQSRSVLPLSGRLRDGSAIQRRHDLMHEINLVSDLSWIDRLLYRFV